ncbi:hypothetical protein LAZ67_16002179 [Cordylochernes scorpioides]|uniref:Ribosomal RNA large subunit methyltransferase K/L-like methyltransferase domain-containing protein n=1 Tax=Cordylochernes scorpioides TaxID=51811 RepID=A0ABY6LED5_9ARAC|nr:hypothetical protein LAZ67_16002179 [Cordylochernes scorpioides]
MKDILGVRRLNAVLVPKDLTFDQKNARKETASLNLEATTDDPELLKRFITGDETWIYCFDSETTQQASEWRFENEPRPKKARKAPSKVKVMLTVFFDYQGIIHHEFQQGSTITADSYLGVLKRLREAIRQKRPELWKSKSWILHHDNAPAHTALKISKFLQDHSTSGRKFQSIEEIKVESKAMKAIPKTDYQRCFTDWKKRRLLNKYSLKTRKFIGNTSMDPTLAFCMANMARVQRGDLVLDPFVGSGSLLVAAALWGGHVWGTDLDFLMLHGKDGNSLDTNVAIVGLKLDSNIVEYVCGTAKPTRYAQKKRAPDESILTNLRQYKLESQYLDVLVADSTLTELWMPGLTVDSIITDRKTHTYPFTKVFLINFILRQV